MLRGLTRESGHWGTFGDRLQAHSSGATVVALDLPGNGSLWQSRSPARVETMSQWCRAELGARELQPPYHLLAISMGAMVAVDWAARAPETIAGCVLINTSLRPFAPWYRRLRPSSYLALARLALGLYRSAQREAAVLALTSGNPGAHASVLEEWNALRAAHPVSTANAMRQLIAAARFLAPATRPPVPMLVLTSACDRLVHPVCSRQLAHHWSTDLAVHPDAGHDLTLDDGDWVLAQIDEWLRRERMAPVQRRSHGVASP